LYRFFAIPVCLLAREANICYRTSANQVNHAFTCPPIPTSPILAVERDCGGEVPRDISHELAYVLEAGGKMGRRSRNVGENGKVTHGAELAYVLEAGGKMGGRRPGGT